MASNEGLLGVGPEREGACSQGPRTLFHQLVGYHFHLAIQMTFPWLEGLTQHHTSLIPV